jgi:hypothetical protein
MRAFRENGHVLLVREDYDGHPDAPCVRVAADSWEGRTLLEQGPLAIDPSDYRRYERALLLQHRRRALRGVCQALGDPDLEERLWRLLELSA